MAAASLQFSILQEIAVTENQKSMMLQDEIMVANGVLKPWQDHIKKKTTDNHQSLIFSWFWKTTKQKR